MEAPRVMVVGAGGIGCEVLKNLVLSNVKNITIVDMDSIDASNLNRQFLFTKSDIGRFKADCAAASLSNYLREEEKGQLRIQKHKCRVQDLQLSVFSEQDLVISALDNIEARKYVNSICLKCGLPLVEAGSTGDNGQAYPIVTKLGTECFECRPQPRVKVYPVCTIRLKAEKPEHCVAWARYLYESIYRAALKGEEERNSSADDLVDLASRVLDLHDKAKSPIEFGRTAAKFLFLTLIQEYLDLKETPVQERTETASPEATESQQERLPTPLTWLTDHFSKAESEPQPLDSSVSENARKVMSLEYYADQFVSAAIACAEKLALKEALKFDKEDEATMSFVACASNLRMANFGIPLMNAWDLKSMAGAIQPAVASTNAIVAGIEVLNGLRILSASGSSDALEDLIFKSGAARFVWTRARPSGGRLMISESVERRNAQCIVCGGGTCGVIGLKKYAEWTMERFVKDVLETWFHATDVTVQNAKSVLYDPDLVEDYPEIGQRQFESPSELLTVSWLERGAVDVIVQRLEDDGSETRFEILRGLADQATAAKHFGVAGLGEATCGAAAAAMVIEDEEALNISLPRLGGKRPLAQTPDETSDSHCCKKRKSTSA